MPTGEIDSTEFTERRSYYDLIHDAAGFVGANSKPRLCVRLESGSQPAVGLLAQQLILAGKVQLPQISRNVGRETEPKTCLHVE